MKRTAVRAVALLVAATVLAACSGDCIPTGLALPCPKGAPYVNKYHPGLCYADPQPAEAQP